jgi:hypothetical protein
MRRTLAVALILGLVAGAMVAPAEAGKKKKKKKVTVRTVEVAYENPAFGVGGVGGACSGCPSIVSGEGEIFATIEIIDDASPTGYVDFAYDADGDGVQDLGAGPTVCGSTPEPVPVEPGTEYTAWPWLAGAECAGSSTSGTIKVTFSNSLKALTKKKK